MHVKVSVFGVQTLEFLGHTIGSEGISPIKEEVDTIRQCPIPSSRAQLRRFLGLVNFYQSFIPCCTLLMQPLTYSLKGKPREF